jgi:hypothetical protein
MKNRHAVVKLLPLNVDPFDEMFFTLLSDPR